MSRKKDLTYLIRNIQMFGEGDTPPGNPAQDKAENGDDVSTQDYINAIKNMRENTVPKEKYDAKVRENKELITALIDGKVPESLKGEPEQPKRRTVSELRKALFSPGKELTNLEYVKIALELRDRIIEEEGPQADPFIGGERHANQPTLAQLDQDRAGAETVAKTLKQLVELSNDDPATFRVMFEGCLRDDPMAVARVNSQKNRSKKPTTRR